MLILDKLISTSARHDRTRSAVTAQLLLDLHSADGVKDSGFTAASMGYLFKIYTPVYTNRSIETAGVLYDAYNNVSWSIKKMSTAVI